MRTSAFSAALAALLAVAGPLAAADSITILSLTPPSGVFPVSPGFAVFPSTEAALLEARQGAFAGCISATANLNADLCARAWRAGDTGALDAAVAIRKLFDGKPLVSGVKALLAHIHDDPALARVKPPLSALSASDHTTIVAGYESVRAKRVA